MAAWGVNDFGQLGNGKTASSPVPVVVNTASGTSALSGKTVVAVAAGGTYSLALCSDGTVAAWGFNVFGQLGSQLDKNNSTLYESSVPVAVYSGASTSALYGKIAYAIGVGCCAQHSAVLASPATITAVATPVAGSYQAGATLSFTLTTSAAATVDTTSGTPRLALTVGSATRYATYASGSGTTSLVFTYTATAGDTDTDGIAVTSTAIDLNGGTITDSAGWAIDNTLPTYTLPTILVDTTAPDAPVIQSIKSTSVSGTAEAGSTVTVFVDGVVLGTVVADSSTGEWSLAVSLDQETLQTFTAMATDAAGNTSTESAAWPVIPGSSGSTWIVTTNTDDTTTPTAGMLRYAVNNAASGDTILFALTSGNETITIGDELAISAKSLTINGSNTASDGTVTGSGTAVTITVPTPGMSTWRVFTLNPGEGNGIILRDLALAGGSPSGSGGVMACTSGSIIMLRVSVTGGRVYGAGGGLYLSNCAAVSLDQCSVFGNASFGSGGGMSVGGCSAVMVENCTFSGNYAQIHGGGLNGSFGADGALVNCTLVGNSTADSGCGGGIYMIGDLSLVHCTITGCASGSQAGTGGGVFVDGNLTLLGSIVINNTAPNGSDVGTHDGSASAFFSWYSDSLGWVIASSIAPCPTDAYSSGDIGSLANNGGVSQTAALSPGAPAVGAGVPVYHNTTDGYYFRGSDSNYYKVTDPATAFTPADSSADLISTDQRGVTRAAPLSIGAFQLVGVASVAVPAGGSYKAGTTLDFTVTFSDAVTVDTTSGTPRLALTIGSTTAYAAYDSTASTATALIFSYTVREGDTDTDGIAVTEVDLNGGTTTDSVGYAADLALPTLDTTGVLVDTTVPDAPVITSATASTISGTAEAGSTVEVFSGSTSLGTTTASTSGSWTHSVTLADAIYSLSATATDTAGNSSSRSTAYSVTIDTTAPTVPTGLTASATSPSAVTLGWTASSDAIGVTGYRIYRAGTAIGTSTTISYSDSGLTSGTTYSYTVSAYDAAGHESAQSTAASATTQLSGQQSLSVSDTTSLLAALATAVANPSATFTITLAAGTYTPTSGLTISTAGLTLEGSGTLSGAALASGDLLTISGDDAVVSGLTIAAGTIAITAGADNGTVADCTFTAAGITGTGCDDWVITGSSFSDASTALSFTASDDLTLTDNVIVDCAQALVLTELTEAIVRNNFIADNTTTVTTTAVVLDEVTGAQIDNNTLYAAGTAANAIEYSGSSAVGAIRNNLANKLIAATGTATATLATNYTTAAASWFADVTTGDLHLAATRSAVVDAGTTISDLTADIDGDTRPIGTAYDIGADEYTADTTAPSVPTGLSATANSTTRITLSWTASTDSAPSGVTATGVSGYRIYCGGTAIGTSTTTSYADSGLTAGTTYSYKVTAYDGAANESAASSAVSATTTTPSASDSGSSDSSSGGGGACGLLLPVALALLALGRRRAARG